MLCLTIVAAKTLLFPGGTPQELANALAKVTKEPVAVMRPEKPTFGKISIEPSDDHLFRHYLKLQTGLESPVGWEGFGPVEWPDYIILFKLLVGVPGRMPPKYIDSPKVESVGSGKIKIRSDKFGCYQLSQLLEAVPGAPITNHQLFDRAVVAVSDGPISIDDLALCLSKAVGGTLIRKAGSFEIGFNAQVYRRRMVARLDSIIGSIKSQAPKSYEIPALQFQRDVYAQASDATLTEAFKTRASEAQMPVHPSTYLGRSLMRRLQADSQNTEGNGGPTGLDILKQVDFDRPIKVVVTGKNTIRILAFLKGQGNTTIRF